ncbi:chemotaxis protein CheW [Aquimonas voraii]|uniref:Twitching motility protein PilI n=1 Tax=Aquimonas voraii TaxID=265719 RepID=A0A1G6SX17_9GAMM|nr:chemotaxis protein CheW [Aquimonas voraii]SDD21134.1 twitching motility protein PilI [Aquimonas voraii]
MSAAVSPHDPFAVLADYEARSLSHVAGLPEQVDAASVWRGLGYRLGSHLLVSAISDIAELLTLPPPTPVPGSQPWLLGVSNVRGTLLPVADLKQFLEGERTVVHENTRALVIKQPGGNVAVLIDELFGQRNFSDEQRVPVSEDADSRYGAFVTDAYALAGTVWKVFDMARLVRTAEFRQAAVA